MSGATGKVCPHCGEPLARLGLNEMVFDHPFDLVCFNDDCPYYARGWGWMEQQYGVHASYRYRYDPVLGFESAVPVWSSDALRTSIVSDESAERAPHVKEHP
jgi:hypothetical protein